MRDLLSMEVKITYMFHILIQRQDLYHQERLFKDSKFKCRLKIITTKIMELFLYVYHLKRIKLNRKNWIINKIIINRKSV